MSPTLPRQVVWEITAAQWKAIKLLARGQNGAEQMVVLFLLTAGALPQDLTPHDVRWPRSFAVPPGARSLALVLNRDGDYLVFLPQIQVPSAKKPWLWYTLDFLVAISGTPRLIDLEVDGPYHLGREAEDQTRAENLDIETHRIPDDAVNRRDFLPRLLAGLGLGN